MANTIVVGYDGSNSAKRALEFAAERAKAIGAKLVVAHVLEWSPYSFLTPTEVEERHKRRKEEVKRAEDAVIKPALAALDTSGIEVSGEIKYGNSAETLVKLADEHDALQIVIGRKGQSTMSSRLFGSVAGTLAQIAPCPVTIVP